MIELSVALVVTMTPSVVPKPTIPAAAVISEGIPATPPSHVVKVPVTWAQTSTADLAAAEALVISVNLAFWV